MQDLLHKESYHSVYNTTGCSTCNEHFTYDNESKYPLSKSTQLPIPIQSNNSYFFIQNKLIEGDFETNIIACRKYASFSISMRAELNTDFYENSIFKNNLDWYIMQNQRLYRALRTVSEVAYSKLYAGHFNKTLRYNGQTYLVTLISYEHVWG
jgi:hypothetical protein